MVSVHSEKRRNCGGSVIDGAESGAGAERGGRIGAVPSEEYIRHGYPRSGGSLLLSIYVRGVEYGARNMVRGVFSNTLYGEKNMV